MKTITFSPVKSISCLALIILGIWACGNQQGNVNDNKGKITDSKTVKKPDVNIHAAALTGNLNAIEDHINAGSDLNEKDEYGSTPLIIASTFGKTDVAIALIDAGADLNLPSNEGSTPLHTAAFFCRTDIVKALLDKGADKTIKNNYGSTPYESVAIPFENVKSIYDQMSRDLGLLGLKLDYGRIEKTRPEIAEMLK